MGRLIVFTGLPGSGKTTLATILAEELPAVLLNKDILRAALFAAEHIEYSGKQNDFCMEVLYDLAGYHLQHYPERHVIMDGRTYSKKAQIDRLTRRAAEWPCQLHIVECRARLVTLLNRVQNDGKQHLAQDRTTDMVRASYQAAEPLQMDRLIIQTDDLTSSEALRRIREHIGA